MARGKSFNEEQVLDKARDLFWLKGYEAASMQDLVDSMGINRQSIYDTFGGKEKLFEKALIRYQQQSVDFLQSILSSEGSALIRLGRFIENLRIQRAADKLGCFTINTIIDRESRSAPATKLVNKTVNKIRSALTDCIAEGQKNGEIRSDKKAADLADIFFSAIISTNILCKIPGNDHSIETITDFALNSLRPL